MRGPDRIVEAISTGRGYKRAVVALVAIAVVLAPVQPATATDEGHGAAGGTAGHGEIIPETPRFAIVGDSITYIATDELLAVGATVEAFGGVHILQARPALQELAAQGRRRVVIGVGTMDVASWTNERRLRARVRAVFNDLRTVPCIVWIDLRYGSAPPGLRTVRVFMFNRLLVDIAGQFGGHVAAWSTASEGHPGWFREDGLHPNDIGQVAYSRFVARSVSDACQSVP